MPGVAHSTLAKRWIALCTAFLLLATAPGSTVDAGQDDSFGPSPGGEGDSGRTALLADGGNVSGSASNGIAVPNGSGLVTPYDPPKCDFYEWKQRVITTVEEIPLPEDAEEDAEPPPPKVTNEIKWFQSSEVTSEGSYEYYEVSVDNAITDQDLADEFAAPRTTPPGGWNNPWNGALSTLGAVLTPLEDLRRRFRIRCILPESAHPQGILDDGESFDPEAGDDSQYAGEFVDVGPLDALWGLEARFTHLFTEFDLIRPEIVDPATVGEWGGLVVRSPAWFGIDPYAWQEQSRSIDHLGFSLALVAEPNSLSYQVQFAPLDPADNELAGVTKVECVGTEIERYTATGTILPAPPSDFPEFAEPGTAGACGWTPPARGCVTVTAEIGYTIFRFVDGFGEEYLDHTWTSNPTTFYSGELRAVNVNDVNSPRSGPLGSC